MTMAVAQMNRRNGVKLKPRILMAPPGKGCGMAWGTAPQISRARLEKAMLTPIMAIMLVFSSRPRNGRRTTCSTVQPTRAMHKMAMGKARKKFMPQSVTRL